MIGHAWFKVGMQWYTLRLPGFKPITVNGVHT